MKLSGVIYKMLHGWTNLTTKLLRLPEESAV